jgi:hypothetical protein
MPTESTHTYQAVLIGELNLETSPLWRETHYPRLTAAASEGGKVPL